jgi:hypothetical protein
MVLQLMRLYLAAHLANCVLDLALRLAESILYRHHDALVLRSAAVSFGDENILMLRHRDADSDLERFAFPVPRLRCDDRHLAARYPAVEFFQPFSVLFDFRPDRLRRFTILKTNLKRHLHVLFPDSNRPGYGAQKGESTAPQK